MLALWSSTLETLSSSSIHIFIHICPWFQKDLAKPGLPRLDGLTFLDLGCGSGLHSLAAVLRGASVLSVDVDPNALETQRQFTSYKSSNNDSSVNNMQQQFQLFVDLIFGYLGIKKSWSATEQNGMAKRCEDVVELNLFLENVCDFNMKDMVHKWSSETMVG